MDDIEGSQTLSGRPTSTVERAYELARAGPCTSIDDIRRQLERERYPSVSGHLSGPTIRKQLRQLCRDRASQKSAAILTGE